MFRNTFSELAPPPQMENSRYGLTGSARSRSKKSIEDASELDRYQVNSPLRMILKSTLNDNVPKYNKFTQEDEKNVINFVY